MIAKLSLAVIKGVPKHSLGTRKNPNKCIMLMNGADFRKVLSGEVDLQPYLRAKVRKLKIEAEPFYGADEFLRDQNFKGP
ncbi:MAG: hypothetical protein Q7O12_07865 [Deltaproteobacteria bacterium]|nr:hypothetical protein [Deltaproteobacteria bacterium]